jgi:hypothetical protein
MDFKVGETLYYVGTGGKCVFEGFRKDSDGEIRGLLNNVDDNKKSQAFHISHFERGFVTRDPSKVNNRFYLKKIGKYDSCFNQNCSNSAGTRTYCATCRKDREEYFRQEYRKKMGWS